MKKTMRFEEFLTESKSFKDFYEIAQAADKAYGDMQLSRTKNGFVYADADDERVEVIVKNGKASIVGGEQNMSLDQFADLISSGDVESLQNN